MPKIVASAPGRCGLLGNPSDMYGGSVLSCSLDERAICILEDSSVLTLESEGGQSQPIRAVGDLVASPELPLLDLSKAVLRGMGVDPAVHHFHLSTTTEIPMQAGLAGSTALIAVVHGAVSAFLGKSENPYVVAEQIRRIEYDILSVICGFQDQHMAVFGGLNYMDFRGKGSHLPIDGQPLATVEPLASLAPTALPFVLAHTGVKHHSGQAHRPVRQRWLEGDPEVRRDYDEVVPQLAREGKRLLLDADWVAFAELMNKNQEVQRRLGASGAAVDALVEVALANGALGAKLAGAGQGGTVLALTFEPERTVAALKAAGAGRILVPKPGPGLTIQIN